MKNKVKKFIESTLKDAKNDTLTAENVINMRGQAFGAMVFCLENNLIEYDDFADYWDEKREEFSKLAAEKARR